MSEGWNILVVDDEPPIRAELRYLLEKDTRVGQIAEAGNVTEAVESILSNKPDVLFLDITMPGRSGIELAETLQNLKTPPVVVFVTAFAEYAAAFGWRSRRLMPITSMPSIMSSSRSRTHACQRHSTRSRQPWVSVVLSTLRASLCV